MLLAPEPPLLVDMLVGGEGKARLFGDASKNGFLDTGLGGAGL